MEKIRIWISEYSLPLGVGTVFAILWANLWHGSYEAFVHFDLIHGWAAQHGEHGVFTVHFLVNDVCMAIFFAVVGKEVFEEIALPNGGLRGKKAASPLFATLGGVIGPASIYLLGCLLTGTWEELNRGWAIPCATDIAFAALVARVIFGSKHPAFTFLLTLAIADDALGLVILAIFYPSGALEPHWLLLTLVAMGIAYLMNRSKVHSFWWYLLLPGTMSWMSFWLIGIHPALGLLPVVVVMPHSHSSAGLFAREELGRHDTLNEFEHWFKLPVEFILGAFGLVNAGIAVAAPGTATWLVLAGLLIGKPLGIVSFTRIAEACGIPKPDGIEYKEVFVLGIIASVGFTLALFVSVAAFPPGDVLNKCKMGALGSFTAVGLALIATKLLRIQRST